MGWFLGCSRRVSLSVLQQQQLPRKIAQHLGGGIFFAGQHNPFVPVLAGPLTAAMKQQDSPA
jgi:hypothetical protein